MEVSGVFMSCDTFVISSVLSRSDFIRCSTAAAMPSPMEFKFSAWCLNSQYMCFVSALYSNSPAASFSPAALSDFICHAPKHARRKTSVSSTSQQKSAKPL